MAKRHSFETCPESLISLVNCKEYLNTLSRGLADGDQHPAAAYHAYDEIAQKENAQVNT